MGKFYYHTALLTWILGSSPRMTIPQTQSLVRHDWVPFANGLGFGAKPENEAQW